ncbi:protein-tyrosine-phosphatase [Fulvivirgaceae bacterium BMA12]|uniref:Protein-tyrosine-phosphatase n=1 Tax=Agaribacillus aureus TaxID=3051825 RepID=A0ABT8LAQ1_9BACT|nr:protein-tyrosine-phosphatase [Fulvivirgaceae bacterium BMA12]
MPKKTMPLNSKLAETIKQFNANEVNKERRDVLQPMIAYIQAKVSAGEDVNLNFICTHNSRRSQLSQIWAQAAAYYYGVEASCYSGGVEVTAFNERAVEVIKKAGFNVTTKEKSNPIYFIFFSDDAEPISTFSKTYDDAINPTDNFAAVMTCSHADENCPFIPGAESRIPVRYDDPKAFDGTPMEAAKYEERSIEIANEMFYVFSQVNK